MINRCCHENIKIIMKVPIVMTLVGIVTDDSHVHPEKALSAVVGVSNGMCSSNNINWKKMLQVVIQQ